MENVCSFYTYPSSARAKDGVRMRHTTWRNASETITAYAMELLKTSSPVNLI